MQLHSLPSILNFFHNTHHSFLVWDEVEGRNDQEQKQDHSNNTLKQPWNAEESLIFKFAEV